MANSGIIPMLKMIDPIKTNLRIERTEYIPILFDFQNWNLNLN